MKDVQGWWEVPSICYYCSLLGNAFGLPDFTIERLEEALSSQEEDVLLTEMYTALTQAILPNAVDKSWREKVAVIFSERNKNNPFEKSDFEKVLSSWEKLDILYNLCEMRMECSDVNGMIKTIEKWQLKTLPIGEDSDEMLYWYFCGTRIYRQDRNVEHLERKSARRSVKRQKSITTPALVGMSGMKKYAYETLLKLTDTPRSNLIKEEAMETRHTNRARQHKTYTHVTSQPTPHPSESERENSKEEKPTAHNIEKANCDGMCSDKKLAPISLGGDSSDRTTISTVYEGHEHWSIATATHRETQLFTARFETSTEPEEETLYRNLVKVVLPKIDIVVAEQERKEMLAGERKGLTRSGRKVVARYKNGFVASTEPESSDKTSETPKEDLAKRQSKRRRTQPPSGTPVRRSSRHNSDLLGSGKKEKSKERPLPVRATSRTTRRSSKLQEFTEPPSTDTDDEVDENEDEEDDKDAEEEEEEKESEKKSPTKERSKQSRKSGTPTPARRRGPGRPTPGRPTIKDQIAEAMLLRDKEKKGKPKHVPTGEGPAELVERLSNVMATLTRHPEAWQFNEPVNEDFAPYYYTLIETPKDFNMIERAVIDQQYKCVGDFVDDINLVFTNCYDYNGPINEYTRAARVMEKYFRRLMRELCREDYTFDGPSVIYPGKRLFVNRHKRIKALKLAGIAVYPQRNKPPPQDESSRDSTTSAMRSPGGDENSNDGSEKSAVATTKPKRRSNSRRKKTADQEQTPVSFTALLSEGGPQHYPAPHYYGYPYHPGYPPYYYGYYDPYRAAHHHPPVENSAPTYIELAPRPMTRKRVPCKNDIEPLLFPHLPKSHLPKPTLTADKVREDLILRDLAASQPSQINRIDSTTTPPETTEKKTEQDTKEENKDENKEEKEEKSEKTREAAPDSTIEPSTGDKENGEVQVNGAVQVNGDSQSNGDIADEEVSLNNEAVPKKTNESSEASPKKVEVKSTETPKPSPTPATPAVKPAEQPAPTPHNHVTHYQQPYTNGGYYGQHYSHHHHPGYYSGYYGNQHHPVSYNPHHAYHTGYTDPYGQNSGYHHPHHQQGYHGNQYYHHQQHQQYHQVTAQHPHSAQYSPSPLLGEQALYVSRTKQITNTGRSRARQPRARSGTPSKRKQAPPSPLSLDVNKDAADGAGKDGGEVIEKILPPTPPKETKKQKKIFDIRIPPKKRVRS